MKWHDSAEQRKAHGDTAERAFLAEVRCHCGGEFRPLGQYYADCTCADCGQLVDVKSSPQAHETGNVAVSARPFEHYAPDQLLTIKVRGQWLGAYRCSLQPKTSTPFEPTHHSSHRALHNTRYYLISLDQFRPLSTLGYAVAQAEASHTHGRGAA